MTGIPRLREWDAVVLVEIPELEASSLADFELSAFGPDETEVRASEAVPRRAVDRLAHELDGRLDRPWEALAVRKDKQMWSAGATGVRGDLLELPAGFPATALEVVAAPDGTVEARADGEPIDPALAGLFADAVAELERRGRERFESFVVRADKVGGRVWQLTLDPL